MRTYTKIALIALCSLGTCALSIGVYTNNQGLCLITAPVWLTALLIYLASRAIYGHN